LKRKKNRFDQQIGAGFYGSGDNIFNPAFSGIFTPPLTFCANFQNLTPGAGHV